MIPLSSWIVIWICVYRNKTHRNHPSYCTRLILIVHHVVSSLQLIVPNAADHGLFHPPQHTIHAHQDSHAHPSSLNP